MLVLSVFKVFLTRLAHVIKSISFATIIQCALSLSDVPTLQKS